MRVEFTRTRGKDKRPRRRRGTGEARTRLLLKGDKLRRIELGTRAFANVGRGFNSLANTAKEGRQFAKWLGINPVKQQIPVKTAFLTLGNTKEGIGLLNATTRVPLNIKSLLRSSKREPTHAYIHHVRSVL